MSIVFKYQKQQYEDKQNDLKKLYDQLRDLLDDIQEEKGKLIYFWNDNEAAQYSQLLADSISKCKTALANTQITIDQVQSDINEMENNASAVDDLIDAGRQAGRLSELIGL